MEEALFRADKRSWLITNEWDGEGATGSRVCTLTGQHRDASEANAIVLGISHELVHVDRARAASVPMCRRFSGGGTGRGHSTVFASFLLAGGALPDVAPYPGRFSVDE